MDLIKKYVTIFYNEFYENIIDDIKRDFMENVDQYKEYDALFISRDRLKKILELGSKELDKIEKKEARKKKECKINYFKEEED